MNYTNKTNIETDTIVIWFMDGTDQHIVDVERVFNKGFYFELQVKDGGTFYIPTRNIKMMMRREPFPNEVLEIKK